MQSATRIKTHGGTILRCNWCAADAIKHRAGVGNLDHRNKADAAIDTIFARFGSLIAQGIIIHQLGQFPQRAFVTEVIQFHPRRRVAWITIVSHQIDLAQRNRVHPNFARGILQ